jgi:hypothetical protein
MTSIITTCGRECDQYYLDYMMSNCGGETVAGRQVARIRADVEQQRVLRNQQGLDTSDAWYWSAIQDAIRSGDCGEPPVSTCPPGLSCS